MNLQSEITYYSEMGIADKARLMASFLSELTIEARATYGPAQDTVHDGARLRFTNEMCDRVTKLIEQYLGDDKARPADDVVLRMLLSPRADKVAERMVHNCLPARAAELRALRHHRLHEQRSGAGEGWCRVAILVIALAPTWLGPRSITRIATRHRVLISLANDRIATASHHRPVSRLGVRRHPGAPAGSACHPGLRHRRPRARAVRVRDLPGIRRHAPARRARVVFLLFTLGLEFSWPRMVALRREVFGLGALQVAGTAGAVALIARMFGLDWAPSIVMGGAIAMSSTVLIVQQLAERAELNRTHGRLAFSVVLFQDIAVVPFLALAAALAPGSEEFSMGAAVSLVVAGRSRCSSCSPRDAGCCVRCSTKSPTAGCARCSRSRCCWWRSRRRGPRTWRACRWRSARSSRE